MISIKLEKNKKNEPVFKLNVKEEDIQKYRALKRVLFESKKIPVVLHVVNKDKLDYMIEKHTKEWINGTKMYRSWNIGASYSKQNF